jgi:hypothetical protein
VLTNCAVAQPAGSGARNVLALLPAFVVRKRAVVNSPCLSSVLSSSRSLLPKLRDHESANASLALPEFDGTA